ncbi:MAG: alpha/beta hydrolase [Flavobacteriales bacterium]|jgi:para-nitrobenzyl esterase|nr:alpha/beta hydrolase [Flavobacteriales bacterium]
MKRISFQPLAILLSAALLFGGTGCKQLNRVANGGQHGGKGQGGGGHAGGNTGGNTASGGSTGTTAPGTDYYTDLNMTLGSAPIATSNRFAANIPYGSNNNSTFDIIMPKGPGAAPLVIFIHGGGFTSGDKGAYYKKFATETEAMLAAGFGVATINYRFIPQGSKGVMNSLADSRRCLQFIRYHAAEFGVDKNRIGLLGVSAGAGTSIWLGVHDEMADPNSSDPVAKESTRVQAVAAINPQSTYDMLAWDDIFGPVYNKRPSEDTRMQQEIARFYGLSSFNQVQTPDMVAERANLDMPRLMDKSDPPMWLNTDKANVPPDKMGILLHHPLHVKTLAEAASAAGISVEASAAGMSQMGTKEPFTTFFIRELK